MTNKFEVEFSYSVADAGRQDQLMLRPLKNFLFTPIGAEKDEDYRCVTVGIDSDVASGVHIVNALQESVRLLDEKGVKLSTVVYSMGKSVDLETPVTVDQATVMKVKELVNKAGDEFKAEITPFNGGTTVSFAEVARYNDFKQKFEEEFKSLESKGVKITESSVRNHLYEVSSYTCDKKIGSVFGNS